MRLSLHSQRGSAIIMLFIAVALFGMISYVFLQGSRGNVGMITKEADKATVIASQDCSNAVSMATKRLNARGCTAVQISNDSTGAVGAGPVDGSCAIYHPNGGGVKGNCVLPPAPADICTTGAIGTVCTSDAAIYIGSVSGNRIYAAPADEGALAWSTEYIVTGATSTTDGQSNSNNATIVSQGAAIYPAIFSCRNKAPAGTWYMPSQDEFGLIWTNSAAIDLVAKGFDTSGVRYWSSTEFNNTSAWYWFLDSYSYGNNGKTSTWRVRCVRR